MENKTDMDSINLRKEDQILMSLVHFFVTKENYSPIFVQGIKDEIWLEKVDGPYRVIRINNNYIRNDEQFNYDQFKISSILKQIKKKTFSLKINALNINLKQDDRVKAESHKNIDSIKIDSIEQFSQNKDLLKIFSKLKNSTFKDLTGLDLVFNITSDINKKTENDNKKYAKIFEKKKIIITSIISLLCILLYIISLIVSKSIYPSVYALLILGANNVALLKQGQVFRLITYAFLHGSLVHLITNLYSLKIIGSEVESKFGKWRFCLIYFLSAISGGLLSAGFSDTVSIGASGAIFGLLGSMLYFSLSYRLYMKEALYTKIIPVIALNLLMGFMLSGIDNAGHIGGLIMGFFVAMAVGMPDIKDKSQRINGIILCSIFMAFLFYLVFVR